MNYNISGLCSVINFDSFVKWVDFELKLNGSWVDSSIQIVTSNNKGYALRRE